MLLDIFYFHADSYEYVALARNILEHFVFSRDLVSFEIIRTPGYPAFLAAAMFFAGKQNFLYLVDIIQIFFVGCTAYLTNQIGKIAFDNPQLGKIAAVIYLLIPTTLYYAFSGMTETLFTFVFIAAVWCVIRQKNFFSGALSAFSILIRPIAVFSPLLFIPMAMRANRRGVFAFLLGFLLILTPWVARNYYHGFGVSISEIGSFNLAHGNAAKFYAWQNNISEAEALEIIEKEAGSEDQSTHKRIAEKYILQNIPAYALFHIVKTTPFFFASSIKGVALNLGITKPGDRTADLLLKNKIQSVFQKLTKEWLFTLESIARVFLTIFMFFGAWRAWKERKIVPVFLFFMVLLFAFLTSPWSEVRLRMPFEPYMLLLALSIFFTRSSQVNSGPR